MRQDGCGLVGNGHCDSLNATIIYLQAYGWYFLGRPSHFLKGKNQYFKDQFVLPSILISSYSSSLPDMLNAECLSHIFIYCYIVWFFWSVFYHVTIRLQL